MGYGPIQGDCVMPIRIDGVFRYGPIMKVIKEIVDLFRIDFVFNCIGGHFFIKNKIIRPCFSFFYIFFFFYIIL